MPARWVTGRVSPVTGSVVITKSLSAMPSARVIGTTQEPFSALPSLATS